MPEPRFLVSSEVATLLRCRKRTVDGYRKRGLLSAVKLGRAYLYSAAEVEAAIARASQHDDEEDDRV
jgi:excisionase family DNA binding protein